MTDTAAPLLSVEHLTVQFRVGRGRVQAVSDVSFDVVRGETLGLVGESGCGKSTTGRTIVRVQRPTAGAIRFDGQDIGSMGERELRPVRRRMQMIFQDPISSLNPRRRVSEIVAEPLAIDGWGTADERGERARAMLTSVGIDPDQTGDRRPQEFSGGQCQRISIAR
ncbi:MAG: dipeptide/oligopeptide/nickel ABC transporter ATP-binding protein, partial [Actinomycetota bacterium]|nr:dipeptide/oligopeptide/nickel ABC transporter ATP-binding protein [Actinomycetota bacterium]